MRRPRATGGRQHAGANVELGSSDVRTLPTPAPTDQAPRHTAEIIPFPVPVRAAAERPRLARFRWDVGAAWFGLLQLEQLTPAEAWAATDAACNHLRIWTRTYAGPEDGAA